MATPERHGSHEHPHKHPEARRFEGAPELERQQTTPDNSIERARSARLEAAQEAISNKEHAETFKEKKRPTKAHMISKATLDENFDEVMRTTRSQLSLPERTFSKLIHRPGIEKAS